MNKLPLLLSLLILVLLTGCTSEEERRNSLKIDLKFTVRISQPVSTAARTHALPDGVKLLITVKSKSGKLTLTHYPLDLTRDGDQYISELFAVDPGRYVVDDFFVVNSSSLLLCATPKEKSSLASQVREALPFSFTASKGKNNNLVMEVIPVAGTSPEDFGYTSFGIDVAQSFGIAVFESASGSRKLTGATLTLEQDSLEILNFPLEERLNDVPFEGNPEEQFLMVVSKEGFIPYRELTTYNELKEKEGSSGVEIDLTPLGEYLAVNDFVMGPIIGFNNPATITIFTPNGQATSHVAQDYDPDDFYSQTTWLALEYMETTDRTVYIKEDLEKVNFLMISNATTLVTTYTPNLAEINIGGEFDALDFSNNTKLWQITFNGVVAESLIFPEEHEIRAVALYYNTSHVPYIIENIYRNAVRKNLHNGSMTLDDLNDDILQSFSPEVRAMLDDLRTNYGWAVYE
jgi:hypothetical protein